MDFNENRKFKIENIYGNVVQLNANINVTSVPYRLKRVFDEYGLKTKIVTMQSKVNDNDIIEVQQGLFFKLLRKFDANILSLKARFCYPRQAQMPFSYYHVGMNVKKSKYVQEADIIIIHWIAGTFLSMHGIQKLLKMHKNIIIVCHDNWHFTGGCHVRMGCDRYKEGCGMCPQLGSNKKKDWSYQLCSKKRKVYLTKSLIIVSPSSWMDNNVKDSQIFHGKCHYIIPNPIDTKIYKPIIENNLYKKVGVSKETIILAFGAVDAEITPYKGYAQLMNALQIYKENYLNGKELLILIFGSKEKKTTITNGIKVCHLGYLSENEMVQMYNMSDVYVVPSLEDSFNNTVAESMACETPVASFATGGIVDIIQHRINGYLAEYNSPADLADGIHWILNNNKDNCLGIAARQRIEEKFTNEIVGQKYLELFGKIMRREDGKTKI